MGSWLGKGILRCQLPTLYSFAMNLEITLQQGALSDQHLLNSFSPNLTEQAQGELQQLRHNLAQLHLIHSTPDDIQWKATGTGAFSVQLAYKEMKGEAVMALDLRHIWKLKAPPRMIIFGWLAIRNRILTHDNLKNRGCIIITRCPLCKVATESVHHLFHNCAFTREVYRRLTVRQPSPNWPARPVLNITDRHQVGSLIVGQRALLLIMHFIVWRERRAR